jgi:hypothetical protein
MSIPKRSHGKTFFPDNFVGTVAKAIEDAGFEVHLAANPTFDLTFLAANGDRIAVRCILTSRVVNSDKKIRDWLDPISKSRPPIKEALIVASFVPTARQHMSGGFYGFELVHYKDLLKFLKRYKRPRAKPNPKSQTARIASTVKANRSRILIATEVLALQIDDKLAKLKTEKPNDPETIATRDSTISDYEALRDQVAVLQHAVAKLTQSAKSKDQASEAAISFGEDVQGWWKKQHANILEKSAEMGLILSAVGVCSLLGVHPNMAMVAATALVGGKSVAKALKGINKVNT